MDDFSFNVFVSSGLCWQIGRSSKNLVYFFNRLRSIRRREILSESSGLESAVSRTMKVRRTMARDEGWLAPAFLTPTSKQTYLCVCVCVCVWIGIEKEEGEIDWECLVWVFVTFFQKPVCLCDSLCLSSSQWSGMLLSLFPLVVSGIYKPP